MSGKKPAEKPLAKGDEDLAIVCTETGRLVMGRWAEDGQSIAVVRDVTGECFEALIELIGVGGSVAITANGVPAYRLDLRLVGSEQGLGDDFEGERVPRHRITH